ncbi:MAG: 2-oxoglutarate dehydrogenase E1 component [Gammaproteobacteria bacterium]
MKIYPTAGLHSDNAAYMDELYHTYRLDPGSVAGSWRAYFEQIQQETQPDRKVLHSGRSAVSPDSLSVSARKQVAVLQLINAYRFRGHRQADLDPLRQYVRPDVAELDPAFHGLRTDDSDCVFNTGSLYGPPEATLSDILKALRQTYCRSIGAEYMHINETAQKRWLQQRLELNQATPDFNPDKRRHILRGIIAASKLEEYLHSKYVGQKRFSLEGGESLIPLLDELVQHAGDYSVREVVIGMAHRGRINVLVNTVGKRPAELFQEFEGKNNSLGSGDVKYHLGYSSNIETSSGPIHLTLAFNPSHLEIIDPVVEGSVRARQERREDLSRDLVLPIVLHGDAAFSGQGVVMETFSLSQTRGYSTGGTIHIIVNNQIGFTTSDPLDSRSTLYCSDVAKMVQAPIFHVNGDDPEALVFVGQLALDYRMEFNHDIVIDLVCYRRHGHSEADEPAATQPLMYQRIRQRPGIQKLYSESLIREGVVSASEVHAMEEDYLAALERGQAVVKEAPDEVTDEYRIDFDPFKGTDWRALSATSLERERVQHLGERFTSLPEGFTLHPSVSRIIENRRAMGRGEHPLDWGFAETLAYASLVEEGHPVRISGQDSARGTFFHRHAVLHDSANGNTYLPLQHIAEDQAQFLVINSILSEEAVLAFEYGYSSSEPNALVIWEAQFGDFGNNAQVVIDQFISSCEAKWRRYCGLVMFLPHGYDGQGPEHSSARLERYLQLCAEDNMQVCIPSTPAQMFHLLRRQVLRPYRKPLVVMTPKSLLRHKLSTSSLEQVCDEGYRLVIDDIDPIDPIDPHSVIRVLFCSGKVYYDLLETRRANRIQDIAILRLEQLYPFPKPEVEALLRRYPNAKDVVWVQEEPRNQGAWSYLLSHLHLFGCLEQGQMLLLAARPNSASPAVGYLAKHLEQQQRIVGDALLLSRADVLEQKRA